MKKITKEQLKALKDTLEVFKMRKENPQKESKMTNGLNGICLILAIKLGYIIYIEKTKIPSSIDLDKLSDTYPEMINELNLKQYKRDSIYSWHSKNNSYRIKFLTKWIKKYE